MSKLAKDTEPKLPTWFTQSFNERIVADVKEELREAAEHARRLTQTGLTDIDEEQMAQYRADLHRRMEDIRMSQVEHAEPVPQAAPRPRTRHARHAAVQDQTPAPNRELSTLATTGLVVAVLAAGAGIGYLASLSQIVPSSFALFETTGQKIQSLYSAPEAPTRSAAVAVEDVDGAASAAIPIDLAAPEANTTVIYKMSGIPAEAYLPTDEAVAAQNVTLKPDVVSQKNQAKIEAVAEVPSDPEKPAKPLEVAVEPPPSLEKTDIRIEPAASKPGGFNMP